MGGANLFSTKSRSVKNIQVSSCWMDDRCQVNNNYFRITRSLKMHIYNLRWLAKLNFNPDVSFEFRELRQFGKFLTDLPGLQCAWVHPRHQDKYSLLIKFDGKRVPSKKFFSPMGFHGWDYLNSQYQGRDVK